MSTEMNPSLKESIIVENITAMTKAEITRNISEGSFIVVTVGNDQKTATREEMDKVKEHFFQMLKDEKNVKAIVVPHFVNVKVFSVPHLVKNEQG